MIIFKDKQCFGRSVGAGLIYYFHRWGNLKIQNIAKIKPCPNKPINYHGNILLRYGNNDTTAAADKH